MQQAFLIIISVVGVIYALFNKQAKIALGLLILGISFIFAIPNIVIGVWSDVFGAITMILYAVGIFVIVFKKKEKPVENEKEQNEKDGQS